MLPTGGKTAILLLLAITFSALAAVAPGRADAQEQDLKIISVSFKDIDNGGDDVSISWKVVVENETNHELRMMGKIKFLDSDGYVVDLDLFSGYIKGGIQMTFTGLTPTGRTEAEKVSSAKAEIVNYFRP